MVETLTGISMALVVVLGGSMVLDGNLEWGVMVAFALWIQRFFEPIRNLTMQYSQLQRAMAAGVRIFEVIDLKPEVEDRPDAVEMPPIRGETERCILGCAKHKGFQSSFGWHHLERFLGGF